jgi:hypothetical protein
MRKNQVKKSLPRLRVSRERDDFDATLNLTSPSFRQKPDAARLRAMAFQATESSFRRRPIAVRGKCLLVLQKWLKRSSSQRKLGSSDLQSVKGTGSQLSLG